MSKNKRIFTVLVIDGGGVRGIIPARMLQEIEERTGKPVCELFDLVGGASTGAIVAAGIVIPDPADPTKPRHSAKDIVNFYHRFAPKIFPDMKFKSLRKLSAGTLYVAKWTQKTSANGGSATLGWIKLGSATSAEIKALVDGGIKAADIMDVKTADPGDASAVVHMDVGSSEPFELAGFMRDATYASLGCPSVGGAS